jgi:hypothetical protein
MLTTLLTSVQSGSSTMVQHSTHYSKVEGSNSATRTTAGTSGLNCLSFMIVMRNDSTIISPVLLNYDASQSSLGSWERKLRS